MIVFLAEPAGFSPAALERLRRHATVRCAAAPDRGTLLGVIDDVDVLWVRLRHHIDAEVMDAAPRLETIVSPTTGLNHIDLEEAQRRGIRVLSLRGEVEFLKEVRGTAEHTIALMLALLRSLPAAADHARKGGWDRDLFRGRELCGMTVGIVGYGRIGRLVARYLRAFDANLLASDPVAAAAAAEDGIMLVPLPRLLESADLVTLHVSLSGETEGFFGRREFAAMKAGAWFVNTSRGELVDEAALVDALRSAKLAGAAIDVLSGERADGVRDHPLVAYAGDHDNLLITPHIGGCTAESMEKTERFLAEKLLSVARVGPLRDPEQDRSPRRPSRSTTPATAAGRAGGELPQRLGGS